MTSPADLEEFRNHPLWGAVDEAIGSYSGSQPRTAADRVVVEQALTVLKYLREFRSAPVALIPTGRVAIMNNLQSFVASIQNQWAAWDESAAMPGPMPAEIDRCADQILGTIRGSSWPSLQRESRAKIFQEAADNYRAVSEQSLEGLKADADALDAKLTGMSTQVDALIAEAETRKTDSASALADIAAAKEEQAKEAQDQLEAELKVVRDAAAKQRADDTATAAADREVQSGLAATALGQLTADSELGKRLVQLVGDQSQAGGYVKLADRERRAYGVWIGLGISTVAVTLVYLAWEFTHLSDVKHPDLSVVILKSALSLTALAFSGFCFREAGKRQRQSLDARYRALDILVLGPFTTGMEEKQAGALRALLGERIFGASDPKSVAADEPTGELRLSIDDVKKLVDTIIAAKNLGS